LPQSGVAAAEARKGQIVIFVLSFQKTKDEQKAEKTIVIRFK